jgi:hypothetical protein
VGGDVDHAEARKLVHLDAGEITTSLGVATGGNNHIDPVFGILEHGSLISAEAGTGQGGQIQITTNHFSAFAGSVVSAASGNPELSATLEIHSPAVNLAGTLAELPSSFRDAASRMRARCAARRSGERAGSFAVRGPGGIPAEPDGACDASDDCLVDANPGQRDTDQDGYGNACDADYNGDGGVGVPDYLVFGPAFGRSSGDPGFDPDLDANGDGAIGMPEFLLLGRSFGRAPGPSALSRAGSIPCP